MWHPLQKVRIFYHTGCSRPSQEKVNCNKSKFFLKAWSFLNLLDSRLRGNDENDTVLHARHARGGGHPDLRLAPPLYINLPLTEEAPPVLDK